MKSVEIELEAFRQKVAELLLELLLVLFSVNFNFKKIKFNPSLIITDRFINFS